MNKPVEKKTSQNRGLNWYSVGVLGISIVAVSSIISLYVIAVAKINLKDVDTDPIDRAATGAVADLTAMTLSSDTFGELGLLNRFDPAADINSRSFDTVAALLRASVFIADKYQLPTMQEQARKDFVQLANLKTQFKDKLTQTVTSGNVYRAVRKTVESGIKPTQKLTSLSIKLGLSSSLPLVSEIGPLPGEERAAYVQNNKLITMLAVPIAPAVVAKDTQDYYFSQRAGHASRIQLKDFIADDGHTLPSALLIEAEILSPDKKTGQNQTIKRSVCMLLGPFNGRLGSTSINPASTCLAISFPHGKLDRITSLYDILNNNTDNQWLKSGDWQICLGGTIPGSGHMAPTVSPIVREMQPKDVLSLLFYHFIVGQKQDISPTKLEQLMGAKFPKQKAPIKANQNKTFVERESNGGSDDDIEIEQAVDNQVGSCLIQESDARNFAYLYKGGPLEQGTKALGLSFGGNNRLFPPSALPLIIDRSGSALLPGRKSFDKELALNLLTSLYNTNLAATDTLATARIMQTGAIRALKECRDRLYLQNSDLSYLKSKLTHLNESTDKAEYKEVMDKIASVESRISYETRQEKLLVNVMFLAQRARNNAYQAATKSFMCGAQLIKVADSGINRPDGDPNAFVLGKRFIFKPQIEELSETAIYEKAQELIDSPNADPGSPWLAQKLTIFGSSKTIYQKPDTQVMVDGQALSELRAQELNNRATPAVVVLDSAALKENSKAPGILVFGKSPFSTIPIKNGQLVYYCQDALSTGQLPVQVRWSVLARDCTTQIGKNAKDSGQSSRMDNSANLLDPGWCKRADNFDITTMPDTTCPTLAGEWQLRAPLVPADSSMQKVLKGATLTNPENGQRVPQVPPAGVDLM
ncbi:MAG: hypothetical protein IPO31_07500 [Candidatus Obscuribacter sp.]|nr:hypothetical protein [Candidatus Obscuribacter sp.]